MRRSGTRRSRAAQRGERLSASERRAPGVNSRVAQLEADAKELVILGDAIRTRQAARLDLPCVRRHGKVGNERILGLARSMADDRAIPALGSHADAIERLGQRTDLVELDEDR